MNNNNDMPNWLKKDTAAFKFRINLDEISLWVEMGGLKTDIIEGTLVIEEESLLDLLDDRDILPKNAYLKNLEKYAMEHMKSKQECLNLIEAQKRKMEWVNNVVNTLEKEMEESLEHKNRIQLAQLMEADRLNRAKNRWWNRIWSKFNKF